MGTSITTYKNNHVKQIDGYDVVIIGGGTAGAIAAISAGREGLKTLVVEQFGSMGGTQTLGMVTPVMPSLTPMDKGQCAIHKEIAEILQQKGHGTLSTRNDGTWFDPVYLSFVLEKLAVDAGIDILYHTALVDCIVEDGTIRSVVVHNKNGLTEIHAESFIDASGDADLAYLSGAEFHSGGIDGINQAITLRFEMANIDLEKVKQYLKDCGQPFYDTTPGIGTDTRHAPKLRALLNRKCSEGELTEDDISHFQFFSIPGKPGCLSFNCPELGKGVNVIDADFISKKQIEGKRAILRIADFCIKYIPGFEKAIVSHYAPVIGVRESRRLKAEYELTAEDVLSYRKFEDGISQSNYPLDAHGYKDYMKPYADMPEDQQYYEIPFRTLITSKVKNLAVTGRCIGADFFAQSTARVQHTSRATGEAAGIAAKIAKEAGVPLNQVDGTLVRQVMIARGAEFQ